VSQCPQCGKASGHVGVVVPWQNTHLLDVLHSCLEHGLWTEPVQDRAAMRQRIVQNTPLLREFIERILLDHDHYVKAVADYDAKLERLEYGQEWKDTHGARVVSESGLFVLKHLKMCIDSWNLDPRNIKEASK